MRAKFHGRARFRVLMRRAFSSLLRLLFEQSHKPISLPNLATMRAILGTRKDDRGLVRDRGELRGRPGDASARLQYIQSITRHARPRKPLGVPYTSGRDVSVGDPTIPEGVASARMNLPCLRPMPARSFASMLLRCGARHLGLVFRRDPGFPASRPGSRTLRLAEDASWVLCPRRVFVARASTSGRHRRRNHALVIAGR